MRKIKNIYLIIVSLFILGISYNVNADTVNYYLSTKDSNYNYIKKENVKELNVKRGDYINVAAIINSTNSTNNSYQLDKGKLTIRWDEKYVELKEVNGKYYDILGSDFENIQINSSNKESNKFVISEFTSNSLIKSDKNVLMVFKFQVLENASSGIGRIYQMDGEDSITYLSKTEDDKVLKSESLYSEIKFNVTKSSENRLSSIKVGGVDLEYFNPDTTEYDIEVDSDVDKIKIEAKTKDSRAKISGNYGEVKVDYGTNKYIINVIAEDEKRKTYTINVTRDDTRSEDNTLKTLTLSSGELNFSPNITEYNVNVENEINKITVTSSLNDIRSKYVEDYSNKEVELVEGSNRIVIKVISEKGEENTYTININRALSSNNSLKSLKINNEKIELKENEFTYNFIVENDVTDVVIDAVANDPKATVDLKEKYPLEIGDNEINITVIAASGDKASYILNITRKKLLSKDSLLKSLKVKNYDINFKQDIKLYNLKIDDNVEELEITAETEDENAKVEIEGNKYLTNGSIIKINVKAEDGTYTRYFINIEKGSTGISPVIIIIIIMLILLGTCLAILFIRKKKKENEIFEKLDNTNSKEELNETEERKSIEEDNKEQTNEEASKNITENDSSPSDESREEVSNAFEQELPNSEEENSLNETKEVQKTNETIEKGAHEYTGEHEYTSEDDVKEKDM